MLTIRNSLRALGLVLGAVMGTILVGVGPVQADSSSGFTVTGQVFIGSTATPATTGLVVVEYTPNGAAHRPQDSVPVDANGNYRITGLGSGSYSILFHYLGSGPYTSTYYGQEAAVTNTQWAQTVVYNDTAESPTVLLQNGRISGHVSLGTSSTSATAGEVAVSYRVWNGAEYTPESAPTLTDSAGNYSIPNLPQSSLYRLHFVEMGSAAVQSGWWWGGQISNAAGAGVLATGGTSPQTTASVTLPPSSTLSGHVSLGAAGTYAGAGAITLTLTEASDTSNSFNYVDVPGATAVTDASGAYSIAGLTNGNYRLVATSSDPNWAQSTSADVSVAGASSLDLLIARTWSITGHVDLSPGQSAGLGDVLVTVSLGAGGVAASTSTDAFGNYSFGHLSSYQYDVRYRFVTQQYSSFDQYVNIRAADATAPSVVMPAAPSIDGHVRLAGGGGASGMSVSAIQYDPSSGVYVQSYSTTTDSTGRFRFLGLPFASYAVQASDANGVYATMNYSNVSPYYVPDLISATSAQEYAADIDLPLANHITGSVSGVSAADLAAGDVQAEVEVFDGSTNTWAETGDFWDVAADGSYDVGDLPPDDYRLHIVYDGAAGYATAMTPTIAVSGGQTVAHVDVTVQLAPVPQGTVSFLRALYSDFLEREPSQGEIAGWGNAVKNGLQRGDVAGGFVNSDEYRLIRIDDAYDEILGRAAEDGGRMSWLNGMKRGVLTTDDIERALYASDEFFNLQGGTNSQFVQALYVDILHRSASFSEWQGWASQIDLHHLSRTDLISIFWRSLETARERAGTMFTTYFGREATDSDRAYWGDFILKYGDSAVRSALTGSLEYYNHAQNQYSPPAAARAV